MATTAFAIDDGQTINYRGTHVSEIPYVTARDGGVDYQGTCAELGPSIAATGTARATKISNNSKEAKMIYWMVYQQKWFEAPKMTQGARDVLGLDFDTYFMLGDLVTSTSQISHQGTAFFLDYWTESGMRPAASAIVNWYNNFDVSRITVPDEFSLYYLDAGSDQNMTIWGLEERTGMLKLKKASANPSITG